MPKIVSILNSFKPLCKKPDSVIDEFTKKEKQDVNREIFLIQGNKPNYEPPALPLPLSQRSGGHQGLMFSH